MNNLYIDLFAGCGGLSLGLLNSGWTGIFAIEKNPDAFSTLNYNLIQNKNHFQWPNWLDVAEHDLNDLIQNNSQELCKLRGKVKLVAGGPPCQGFSLAGKRNNDDKRNSLIELYIKFIDLVRPEAIVFENVFGFTVEFKCEDGSTKNYSNYICNSLTCMGYNIKHEIIDMSEYGVPQKRRRFILVGMLNHSPEDVFNVLKSQKMSFLKDRNLSQNINLYQAISDLEEKNGKLPSIDSPSFKAGLYGKTNSNYQKYMRSGILTNNKKLPADSHRFVKHTERIVNFHQKLLDIAPRGKRLSPSDLPMEDFKRRGVTVLDPFALSPTITSIPDELIHYKEPRILTVREHARIQSFPDWYQFKGKYTSGGKRRVEEVPRYTQVGNAVPPLFAEQIGFALQVVMDD